MTIVTFVETDVNTAVLRDAFSFLTWFASFFPLRIHWRGQQFYVRDRMLVPVSHRR